MTLVINSWGFTWKGNSVHALSPDGRYSLCGRFITRERERFTTRPGHLKSCETCLRIIEKANRS